jgi:methionyl-tRNA formyltransferase
MNIATGHPEGGRMSAPPLKVVFAGTPPFAATVLRALIGSRHPVVAVLCRPDKPAGRGRALRAPPVKLLALEQGLPVLQPATLRGPEVQAQLAALRADVMVVAAYGLILPQPVLDLPRLGCINVHASLLPRWRGAAPIQRAIEAGDRETGITIMQMEAGLDTGPMLSSRALSIGEHETGGQLHDRLAALGATLMVEALDALAEGRQQAQPQPEAGATYAARLQRLDEWLDWSQEAVRLADRIRAFDPDPGTRTLFGPAPEQTLKIWSARALDGVHHQPPGTVLEVGRSSVRVACGSGALDLLEVQRPGGRRQPVRDWLQGSMLRPGDRLQGSDPDENPAP